MPATDILVDNKKMRSECTSKIQSVQSALSHESKYMVLDIIFCRIEFSTEFETAFQSLRSTSEIFVFN